jgi:peptide/nickel transport system permease protein
VGQFLAHRIIQGVLTVVLVSAIVFMFMELAGDPAILLLPPEAKVQDVAQLRHALGLDAPVYTRYASFMMTFWTSDRVRSFRYQDRILPLIGSHLERSLILAAASVVVSIGVAIPLGALAAVTRGGPVDVALRVITVLLSSVPAFCSSILLIYLFAVKVRLFPVYGIGLANAVLPVTSLALFQIAILLRLFRSELVTVLSQDYLRTARAKGVSQPRVLGRHALKNAAIPVVAMTGLLLNSLVLGAVVVEPIFAWPGIGWLLFQSVTGRDYPVVVGAAMIAAILIILVNLAVDMIHLWLDPRIRTA